ncbi:alpha-L-fucosidase [Parabacteroides sp. PF5-5]|uniref:alpha-L-fucosidase n=1 Tax=unclassified Parabacteroides TaxID=2649774 RepID=UPI002473A451|nr:MULTISPECIES: alpha-L-fucosidase [unclassified Parabacteroides]MDH6305110.1 alpha-L-fucosidase [Parabacteroides sp. PH5-39]MDH6316460.1 alpha-L-fucosidase [Parabacteroides sp. PF5-13]MDH6319970.1 alpha-L-fucosidase [Parabacteroides sp. PH5-13]MDH6323797.1 alpha-L-fucosidase [Parabacteroides sp. PH5-8]MDH6327647.1 alpha-L-fucosidase [Parabacteroides sp. PH5-41]
MHKKILLFCSLPILSLLFTSCVKEVEAPAPYGALPSESQLAWQQMEYYMFIHFGPNTFTDVEWGDGKEDPKVFNPTQMDCRQWASIAKEAGMKAIIITAKHHDGFCLWPSQYSTHTVRESLWKDGKGDVLRELSDACKEYGLKFGVYLSPWDQNHPSYGTPEYNEVFANTLAEVLGSYGDVFEQWFDGANGDAHKGKRQEYDWDLFHKTVYSYHPQAVIFSDVGPGCRWMGNEKGIAGETNWSRLNIKGFEPGLGAPPSDTLTRGNINGEAWVPAETDVSIRPGWFYSPRTDNQVKNLNQLMDIYYTSIGRNSNLLLNVPPSREGRIHPNDSARLMEFRQAIDDSFARDLAQGASLHAINTRGGSAKYKAEHLLDEAYDSYWAADDDVLSTAIEITLQKPETFNRFLVQEYIPLGQRVAAFSLEIWDENTANWEMIADGTTIGYKRILRFHQVTTQKLRLNIKEALACPVLNKVEIYNAPEHFYTSSAEGADKADEIVALAEKWNIDSPAEKGNRDIIDGNMHTTRTFSNLEPIILNLGETLSLQGFSYTPADNMFASHITKYNLYVSEDGSEWKEIRKEAVFNNIKNNPIRQDVWFSDPVEARYVKLEALETTTNTTSYTIAEIKVMVE